ncbi:hypothetical protein [Fibrella forsythiae]|uniref:Uncharacterized protein n=1 Tax=Fibrella forsythiae TaxID=2817061 RepID=A0ABS3JKQ5_9BACT|nr:hypothetical protein [Fibrella forsythiae]MBO0950589.1 hypothetical protein [Fibrella forsythiae]
MNQGFKLRFDQMRENDPTSVNESGQDMAQLYATAGHIRNICFAWPDGKKAFFNYAYLIATEFEPNAEQNLIKLNFSSHQVSLSGYHLESLFMALLDHLPRIVTVQDARYALTDETQVPIVVDIKLITEN